MVQGALVRSIETEEIGIKLYITPLVSDDGYITLKARVEVSSFVEYTPAGYPRVVTREAQTTVRVKDGDVLVIGGLLREEEIKSYEKVPILGDILKAFFSHTKTQKNVQDLVIFLTPRILKEGESPVIPATLLPPVPGD
jgi:general secretion pathway protein D